MISAGYRNRDEDIWTAVPFVGEFRPEQGSVVKPSALSDGGVALGSSPSAWAKRLLI